MKYRAMLLFAALATSLLLSIQSVVAQEVKTELEGTWIVDSALEQGAETIKPIGDKVSFRANNMSIEPKDGQKPPVMTFKLNAKETPKNIDIKFSANDEPQTVLGVYSIEGDTLRLCLARPGAARPAKLKSQSDTMEFSLVLKRKAE